MWKTVIGNAVDQALTLDPLSLIPDSQIIYEEQDIYVAVHS